MEIKLNRKFANKLQDQQQTEKRMISKRGNKITWLYRKLRWLRFSSAILTLIILLAANIYPTLGSLQSQLDQAQKSSNEPAGKPTSININLEASQTLPANHRMEPLEFDSIDKLKSGQPKKASRSSRQYDSSSISASGSGNYASISGDGAAYVGQVPIGTGAGYVSPNLASAYVGSNSADISAGYHDSLARAYGPYPMQHQGPNAFGAQAHPINPIASFLSGAGHGGLFANSMFPLMSKGFDLSEVVCTAIAVAIGAVIVGAPFILIYLFIVNQMNSGSSSGLNPSGGPISLTGPSSSTNVSGRKKRHTSVHEALFKQLSPLMNSEKVAQTFKILMDSMAKYQM